MAQAQPGPEPHLNAFAHGASSLDTDDLAAVVSTARALEAEGRLDDAVEMLLPLAGASAPEAEVLYRLACVRAKQQRLDEAEILLRRALGRRFEDARFHTNLGVVLDLQGRADEAIGAFRRALLISPDDAHALLNLGALYGETGRHEEAVRHLSRCREIEPSFDSCFNLAQVHLRRGDLAAAESLFAEAAAFDAGSAVVHFYLGRCRLKLGRSHDAVTSLRRALEISPDLVQARISLGMTFNKLGQYAAAVKELQLAARALPDEGKVHYQLGIAYDGQSQKTRARECYRRARTLST